MRAEALENAARIADKGVILVATADGEGTPHVCPAHDYHKQDSTHISIAAWFHPRTISNIERNLKVSVIAWDPEEDSGYQLVGEVENVRELTTLHGYTPGQEEHDQQTHMARRLLIRVDEVLDFKQT